MLRWWKALGRTDQIALLGVLVALLGVLPTYLIFFENDKKEPNGGEAIPKTKPITDTVQALTVKVPEDWGHVKGGWYISYHGKQDVGSAIQAGTGSALNEVNFTFSDPNIFVGASSELAKRLQFPGRPESDLADWSLAVEHLLDWSKAGCVLVSERGPGVEGYVGTTRVWENCNGLEGSRIFDYFGVSRGGTAVLQTQVFLPPRFSQQIADDIIGSIIVREEKLPRGAPASPSPGALEVPSPHWSTASTTTSGDRVIP